MGKKEVIIFPYKTSFKLTVLFIVKKTKQNKKSNRY